MAIDGITSSAADNIASLISNGDNTSVAEMARTDGALGKDSFLQLLVTELKYQDPLNPMDNKESIAQLAQFSALEQMQNLNTSFTNFVSSQGADSRAMAMSVLGMTVTGVGSDGNQVSGMATKVSFTDGKTLLTLQGGGTINFNDVVTAELPTYV